MIAEIITNTPSRVWILLIVLLWMGYKSCFERTVTVKRLLIVPLIFLYMEANTINSIFGVSYINLLYSAIGLIIGIVAGAVIVSKKKIVADKRQYSLVLPGEYVTISIIILTFLCQYVIHVLDSLKAAVLYNLSPMFLIMMSILSGISIGRNGCYLYKFIKSSLQRA
jgi:hypothetical protein